MRAVGVALCVGTAAVVLFAVGNDLAPRESPKSFAAAFLEWALPFYLAVVGTFLVAMSVLGTAFSWPWLARIASGLVAGAALAAAVGANLATAVGLVGLEGPWTYRFLAPAAFVFAALGLGAAVIFALDRWRAGAVLALAAPLAAGVAFRSEPLAVPRAAPTPTGQAADRAPRGPVPLVFVGVDGADWRHVDRLLERGELPTIAALKARGAFGPLATLRPTFSPALWNTMMTGRPPTKHGIEGFTSLRVRGVAGALGRTEAPRGFGFARFLKRLRDDGRVGEGPVVSSARRVPALWEIATAHGSPVSVVNMWATWPAEPVLGAIVSERIYYYRQADRAGDRAETSRLTWPEDLYEEIRPLVMAPQDVTYEEAQAFVDVTPEEFEAMRKVSVHAKSVEGEFKYLYSMFETERKVSLHLVERSRRQAGRPFDLLVLFRIVDIACHRALDASELVDDPLSASPEERRKFGRVVSEAYRRVDRALAEILAGYHEPNVVVVSDHGFQRETQGGAPVYQHQHAPPGVFLAAGPAFRAGPVEGLGILDVMPLLMTLKGLPLSNRLEGRLREDLLQPEFLAAWPVRRVRSYGQRGDIPVARDSAAADEELLERLRALGYVR